MLEAVVEDGSGAFDHERADAFTQGLRDAHDDVKVQPC